MPQIPNTRGNPQASDVAVQSALSFNGSATREDLQTVLSTNDADVARLHEDRNVLLTDGGLITFLGTSVQFTSNLKISINSRIAGGSPVVIDLGNTTRSVSADGRMIYAVLNRTAGTAVVTDDASSLPSVTSANKEVFLIAKRVDSADGVKRLYFRSGMALNEGQSARLGSSGSGGSGSGLGDDLGSLTFKASFNENFAELTSDANASVDYSAGKTDPNIYNVVNQLLRISYDASKTVTGTGTSMTLSGTPSFTVKEGDILVVGSEARRITVVTSQVLYTIEAAFSTDPSAAAANVSQVVYSKDLNNYAGSGLAPSTAFSSSISQILLNYEDSSALSDTIFDANTAPVVAYTASSDGTNYTTKQVRPTNLSDSLSMVSLSSAGTNLYLRFFSNASSGSGAVNILKYKVFFHRDSAFADGTILNQAYCFTNGTGNEINCSAPTVVSGKTRIQTTFSFPVAVNSGTTNGAISVYLNGQKIPRFIDSTLTPDAYYKEISQNVVELDRDYSAYTLSVEIVQTVAVVDASDTNSTNLASLQEIHEQGLQSFVNVNTLMTPTATAGTPVAGTFYSSISQRKAIVDLSQDLKARMGIERIAAQTIYQIQDEFGPSNERVWGLTNDYFNQIRFVGSAWVADNTSNGIRITTTGNTTDFVEVTFYGTGLNILLFYNSAARDIRYAVDGGSESANILSAAPSAILAARGYNINYVQPVVSGLSLGIHTVKIRNADSTDGLQLYGFEILTETTSLRVPPGTSYGKGKKLVNSSLQTVSYNSSFDFGSLGTKGGRVLLYQKADGSIGKSVQAVDASQLNMSAADHSNEEVFRSYYWREFGANRSDDFSTLNTTNSTRAFTLEDGTTSLIVQGASTTANAELYPNTTNNYVIIHFVGTGLDIIEGFTAAVNATYTVSVDGTDIVTTTNIFSGVYGNRVKIVSGLPYGSHVVRFLRTSIGSASGTFRDFIVYQPKKPTLPTGATELADYGVLADFSANATAGHHRISQGTIRKAGWREMLFNGAGWVIATTSGGIANNQIIPEQTTNASGNYWEYTFWGTGFDFRFGSGSNRSATNTVTLNGTTLTAANFPTAAFSVYGTGVAFNAGTGVLDQQDAASVEGSGFVTSGLPLAKYTIRITNNTANFFIVNCIDIITPVYNPKLDLPFDLQSTIQVGSTSLGDSRKISPVKSESPKKNVVQALGVQATPSTTSTAYVQIPDLSLVIKSVGAWYDVRLDIDIRNSAGVNTATAIYVNGYLVAERGNSGPATNVDCFYSWPAMVYLPAGVHKIDAYWKTNSGTLTNFSNRVLIAKEV